MVTNATNIARGGIGGLVQAGKTLFAISLKIIGITLSILMAIFFIETEIQRIGHIINDLLSLRERVAALEAELSGLRDTIGEGFRTTNAGVNRTTLIAQATNNNVSRVQQRVETGLQETLQRTAQVEVTVQRLSEGLTLSGLKPLRFCGQRRLRILPKSNSRYGCIKLSKAVASPAGLQNGT